MSQSFLRNKILNKTKKVLTEAEKRTKKKQKDVSQVSTSQKSRSSRELDLDNNIENKT